MPTAADPFAELAGLEGVGSAVGAARDAVDAVLRDRGRRQVRPEQSAAGLLAAARASATLQQQADGDPDTEVDRSDPAWESATIRLYTELIDLSGLIRTAPGQAMARAHAVLCRDLLDDDDLGRIRDDPGVAERISTLNRSLVAATAAPVIVVAGIAHAELITARPFRAGNGVLARAVEHMILIDGDIDPPAVTVPEAGHLQAGAEYPAAVDRYRTGTVAGVRDWLTHTAAAVARGAELAPLN